MVIHTNKAAEPQQQGARPLVRGAAAARSSPAHLQLLQRSAGNAAVARLLKRPVQRKPAPGDSGEVTPAQPVGGWKGADTSGQGWNTGEKDLGSIRRIPLMLDSKGAGKHARDTGKTSEKGAANDELTTEDAAGRVVLLVPAGLTSTGAIDYMVQLHGYTETGKNRPYAGWRQHRDSGEVRDVALDRVEAQLESVTQTADPKQPRRMVAILAQGGTHSEFGEGDEKYELDPIGYTRRVFEAATKAGVWPKTPELGRAVLAAHSGGGHTVRNALAGELDDKGHATGKSAFAEVVLFDAINNPREMATTISWVLAQLDRDLQMLTSDATAKAKEAYLAGSVRFRGYQGDYKYAPLETAIQKWLSANRAKLGPYAEIVNSHYQVIITGQHHENVMRGASAKDTKTPAAKGNIADALRSLDNPTAAKSLDERLSAGGRKSGGGSGPAKTGGGSGPAKTGGGAQPRRERGRRREGRRRSSTSNTMPAGAITAANLGTFHSQEESDFRRRVYERQVKHSLQVRAYSFGVPEEHLGHLIGGERIHKSIESDANDLIRAAQAQFPKDKANTDVTDPLLKEAHQKALHCTSVGVASAYRSPQHDFEAWQAAFANKYRDTAAERAAMDGGPLGAKAEDLMVTYVIGSKAAAGFSNHTQGLAIDFNTVQNGHELSTSHRHDSKWETSWLYFWLKHNGARFGFAQLPSERWHWNHAAGSPEAKSDSESGTATESGGGGGGTAEGPTAGPAPKAAGGAVKAADSAAAGAAGAAGAAKAADAGKAAAAAKAVDTAKAAGGAAPRATGASGPQIEFGPNAHADKVAASSLDVLREVMSAAGITHALISSTARTAKDQARAMYQNLSGHGKGKGVKAQHALYGAAGDAVVDVFDQMHREGRAAAEIREAMRAKIVEIGPSKVSRHCGDPATLNVFDVAPSSLGGAAQQAAFVDAALAAMASGKVSNFIPYPKDPGHHFEIKPK